MRILAAIALSVAPGLANAGIDAVLEDHILPGHAAFAEATADLSAAAERDCTAPAMQPAYNAAFDAWTNISHIRFGPVEEKGLALAIAFWPDPRDQTGKALGRLLSPQDPIVDDPAKFTEVSVAARGFFALERLLYDPDLSVYSDDSFTCRLVRAISLDLSRTADLLNAVWRDRFADLVRNAGTEGNPVFLSESEAKQALFTALSTGLEYVEDQRLGRPLGTFDRPRPTRAEAWRSGRSLRNVIRSLEALRELARTLPDAAPTGTLSKFDAALDRARSLDDPDLAGVADPASRIRIETLQLLVGEIRDAVASEVGADLGVGAGFNSLDGD